MYHHRVTKYDPAFRTGAGKYTRCEWTAFGDVGRSFDGVELTPAEYERVESAYISAAEAFLREAAVPRLYVRSLECHRLPSPPYREGDAVSIERVGDVLRNLLRETYWCKLEADDAYVHVGWDFYLYIGVPRRCLPARLYAERIGLFVEDFESPYLDEPPG